MPYADFPMVYLQKLAAPEHNTDIDNFILLNNTSILARKLRHTEQLIQEARDRAAPQFKLGGQVQPKQAMEASLIHSLKERRQKAFSQHRIVLSLI